MKDRREQQGRSSGAETWHPGLRRSGRAGLAGDGYYTAFCGSQDPPP